MSKTKSKYSTCKVIRITPKGNELIIGYLSSRDEERGEDIRLDMKGYKIVAL